MPEPEPRTLTRRTLVGAAWAAPVVVAAVATPLAAASTGEPSLSSTFAGPTRDGGGGTFYQVYFKNEGPYSLAPTELTVYIPTSGQGWTWQGFGGSGWNYASGGITPTSYTFRYEGTVNPGSNAGMLYFIVSSASPGVEPFPTATLTAMAPGYPSTTLSLPVPY
ncbi:hypothetical protein [Herbiconiux sp. VKM Ac-2851]|uniref:hypothetical protein n=1 Tax=Herbiconiux sp. VKM Ac-2851 TaxID=2739025 RepID=UPI0015651E73|nr:hypothetical protein [Herbiconiux sp. VKM Ac-2851]NQX34020.1 hypothetical protein [Herbiconiux sp. VKM Ac-2851]